MPRLLWIAPLLLTASVHAQDLADEESAAPSPLLELVRQLQARVDQLEAARAEQNHSAPAGEIDLSGDELASIDAVEHEHVLARPWYENVELYGYGAFTYLDSGDAGTAANGSFIVKEATLFLNAEVWEHTYFFAETILTRFAAGNGIRMGELNAQFTNLFASEGERGIGLKVGRFEIPFGEEYFRWDANETPFISFSAADPYGVDEGVELYGGLLGANWIAAVTNGSDGGGADDSSSKLIAAKLYGEPSADVYLSGSALATGDTQVSAFRLSGNSLAPVGAGGPSAAGASPSSTIDTMCWELDCRLFQERRAGVALSFGQAQIDDVDPFSRELLWWQVLPRFRINDRLEALLRFSEIGTDDADEGYRFSGKPVAQGENLGYDTHTLRRLSGALCWTVNTHVVTKFEVGRDTVDLIDLSALDANNDERLFFGIELVASF